MDIKGNIFKQVAKRGEILKVKVLGTVALIDEGKYKLEILLHMKYIYNIL